MRRQKLAKRKAEERRQAEEAGARPTHNSSKSRPVERRPRADVKSMTQDEFRRHKAEQQEAYRQRQSHQKKTAVASRAKQYQQVRRNLLKAAGLPKVS